MTDWVAPSMQRHAGVTDPLPLQKFSDADGDGIPDAIEIQMGSDPMDTLDTPVFGVPSLGPVGLTLTTALLSLAGAAALGVRRRRRSGDGSGPTA